MISDRREEMLERLRNDVIEIRQRLREVTGEMRQVEAEEHENGAGDAEATAALGDALRAEFAGPSVRSILDIKLTALVRDRDRLETALIVLHGREDEEGIHALDDALAELDAEIVKAVIDRERVE